MQSDGDAPGHSLRGLLHGSRRARLPQHLLNTIDTSSSTSSKLHLRASASNHDLSTHSQASPGKWPRSTYDSIQRSLHGARELQLESLPEFETSERRPSSRDIIDDVTDHALLKMTDSPG